MHKHLILYDGHCPFCFRAALLLASQDKKKVFLFTPLLGKTSRGMFSKEKLLELEALQSVILIENVLTPKEKIYTEGKALFRSLWLLPFPYPLLGWISFFPGFLYNFWYRLFVRHRRCETVCSLKENRFKDRFLP